MAAESEYLTCSCGHYAGAAVRTKSHRGGSSNPACKGSPTPTTRGDAEELMASEERHRREVADEEARRLSAEAAEREAVEASDEADARRTTRAAGHNREGSFSASDDPRPRPSPRTPPGRVPEPTRVTVTLHLLSSTVTLFDASRTNPELGFAGSMSDWVDQVAEAFYESIGMSVNLVQRQPVYATAQQLEASA